MLLVSVNPQWISCRCPCALQAATAPWGEVPLAGRFPLGMSVSCSSLFAAALACPHPAVPTWLSLCLGLHCRPAHAWSRTVFLDPAACFEETVFSVKFSWDHRVKGLLLDSQLCLTGMCVWPFAGTDWLIAVGLWPIWKARGVKSSKCFSFQNIFCCS